MRKRILKAYKYLKHNRIKVFGTVGEGNVFTKTAYIDDNAVVGNYNYFGSRSMICFAEIGNYCSIAPNVIIAPANHPVDFITTSNIIINKQDHYHYDLFQDKAIIGNDVWIGANSIIKQGVKVGDGAVIGANSFVNRDVPPYSIVAGTPAELLRYRFDKSIIETIANSNWWDYEPEKASSLIDNIWFNMNNQFGVDSNDII